MSKKLLPEKLEKNYNYAKTLDYCLKYEKTKFQNINYM